MEVASQNKADVSEEHIILESWPTNVNEIMQMLVRDSFMAVSFFVCTTFIKPSDTGNTFFIDRKQK
jgi:hypothetical protein